MRHFYLLIVLYLLLPAGARAQGLQTISGTVQTEAGMPLPGATVFLKGTYTGGSTNEEGQFQLKGDFARGPLTLSVSFVGYETQELPLAAADEAVIVILRPGAVLDQVVVAASRVEETIGQVPVTVEKLDQRQVEQLTTPDLIAGLARFKAIDISSSSMLTTAFSTRGFNSSKSERIIQLADYMDTQLPSLSNYVGNLLGPPVLDVGSVEIVHGPASALYGANAFNGVLLLNSKDPFRAPGLSVRLRGGDRHLLDGQLRYAVKIGDRVAFKISGGATQADDFLANNQDATASVIEPNNNAAGSALGYDAVSRYGDVGAFTFGTSFRDPTPGPTQGQVVSVPAELRGKTLYLPGFSETDLIAGDNKTSSYKVAPSLAVLLSNTVKATVDYRFTRSNTTYQAASRYRFINSGAHQARAQLEGNNWFVRAYTTQDYSGGRDPKSDGSYNLGILGGLLQAQPVAAGSATSYGQRYVGTYLGTIAAGLRQNPNAPADALTAAAAARSAPTLLQPGTPEFDEARDRLIHDASFSNGQAQGARVVLRSIMNEGSAQYNFKNPFADLTVGGAYRQFRLGSDGTLFRDNAEGDRIRNYEYGGYAQATKTLLDEHLKLAAAGRVDRFQNFGTAFSPRASAVYSVGGDKQHNFRASYGRAFRAPTQSDQYLRLDVGRAILLGNVDQGFQGYTTRAAAVIAANPALLAPANAGALADALAANQYSSSALRLEQVNSVEVGYRAQLSKKLYVDAEYFRSNYNNFIATQNFIGNTDGTQPDVNQVRTEFVAPGPQGAFRDGTRSTRVIQIATNVDQQVQSQGAGITVGYAFGPALNLSGNYSYNELLTKDFAEGTQSFFNTPKHKFNVGFDGLALNRALSYNVNYRWVTSFLYESTFATGTVPEAQTVDAQLGYTVKALHTTLQVGATNLFNTTNFQVYGAPAFGRLGYFGLLFDIK